MTNEIKSIFPKIIIGCWQLSHTHNSSHHNQEKIFQKKAIDLICKYVDAGFNVFDCADIYEGVEQILGEAKSIKEKEGHALQIHTKFVPDLNSLENLNMHNIKKAIARSAKRLNVKILDLVQFHWWDYEIGNYIETLKILQKLQLAAKIKYIGLTNFNVTELKKIIAAGIKIASIQVQYSIIDNRPEKDLIKLCKNHNIKIFAYGTLCGGFLSEKWLNIAEPNIEQLQNRSLIKYKAIIDESGGWKQYQMLLVELKKIAAKYNLSIAEFILIYISFYTDIDSIIIGISSKDAITRLTNVINHKINISNEDLSKIAKLRKKFIIPGDVYDLERNRNTIHGKIMRYNLSKNI